MNVYKQGLWKVVTLAALFILCGCGPDSVSNNDDNVSENSNWMSDYAQVIENQYLNQIALPGTHDSGTFAIEGSSMIADDGNPHPCKEYIKDMENSVKSWFDNHLIGYLYPSIVKPLMEILYDDCEQYQAGWSKSQRHSISDQLNNGIRYLDLRVWNDSNLDDFFIVHSLVSVDVGEVLNSIQSFYNNPDNNKELLIIDINHTYDMDLGDDDQLIQLIEDTLKDGSGNSLLIPRCADGVATSEDCIAPTKNLTIGELWDRSSSERIILFYKASDDQVYTDHPRIWRESSITSPWPNTTSCDKLFEKMISYAWVDQDIRDLQADGGFYVLQSIRTPDETTFKQSLETSLWESFDFSNSTVKKYAEEFYNDLGLCSNCSTTLFEYADKTNRHADNLCFPDKIFGQRANIIIVNDYANFEWRFDDNKYSYVDSVIKMNQSRYCDKWLGLFSVLTPNKEFGSNTQYGGIGMGDINGNDTPDLVVFHIDNPEGDNTGFYRIGWDVDQNGLPESWKNQAPIPGWWGDSSGGGGITVAYIDDNDTPDLVVFHIDDPEGPNTGHYRIGWDVDQDGIVASWTGTTEIPGWWGDSSGGGGITVAYIDDNDTPDLVVFHIDDPEGDNTGHYRIGWDVDQDGIVASWTGTTEIPGWWGSTSAGGGIDVAYIDDNDTPDLVVFHIDDPEGPNTGHYRIGWDVDQDGIVASWVNPMGIPFSWGDDNEGGGVAVGDINNNGIPDLNIFNIESPTGTNYGWYRIGLDMNADGTISGSRCSSDS